MTEERFVSYAQNLEDVMLWRALRQAVAGPGFYIDAGASDPTALSVTRAFYDRGWHGINIEPLPEQAGRLRQARPRDVVVEALLSDRAGPAVTFHRVIQAGQTGLSTVDAAEAARHAAAGATVETIEVPVTTLAAVCRDHVDGPVHFLKIDVEGAEAAVLAGADFAAVRPWIVVMEATQPLDASTADLGWEAGLLASGYRFVWFDGLNRFYLAEEHAALARHFTVQPNVFDNYIVYDAPLQDHLAAVAALADRRGVVLGEMEAEIAALRQATAPAAEPGPAAPPAVPAAPPPPPPMPARTGLRGLVRRALLLFYGLFRPVVRPLGWRLRSFLIGPLHEEMAETRHRLDSLMARPLLTERGTEPALLATMEDVLMTLALEASHAPPSTLVAPNPPSPNPASPHPSSDVDRLPKTEAAS